MKICICGKGGSGKSTLVALLAGAINRLGRSVVVLDSDESNTSLYWLLGLDAPPHSLMEMVGGRMGVQERMQPRSTEGERESVQPIWSQQHLPTDQIPADFIVAGETCRLVMTGKIHQSLEGCACAMGSVTREFLKILKPAPDEVVLVDMEAGIEHFGRGVETSVDAVVTVVEPSLESIEMAGKVMALTRASGAFFTGAVLNKIETGGQSDSVRARLQALSVPVIGVLQQNAAIQRALLEGRDCTGVAADETSIIAATLLSNAGA